MRRDQREVERASPLPLRATSIVLALWVGALLLVAFVIVPILFAICGPTPGVQ